MVVRVANEQIKEKSMHDDVTQLAKNQQESAKMKWEKPQLILISNQRTNGKMQTFFVEGTSFKYFKTEAPS